MIPSPDYFDHIRECAAKEWDLLEGHPSLAGPWHQLFRQVQSPRHILSELLQNADDAGATEAAVHIEDHCFIFIHNGEDFTEEHFASLCRFGYSNKRALHTIGFRGVGFKSLFSLGDVVELRTPTLSVAFEKRRFTEPKWIDAGASEKSCTRIRVRVSNERLEDDAAKNLQEWFKSPLSLLFFKHIRRLRIAGHEVCWRSCGESLIPQTEWMTLNDDPDQTFFVARSDDEPFPDDALTEIKEERMPSGDRDVDFPPCRVEIVLGSKGKLCVVLPTDVETHLPFACNAPFIQDPSRLKIKDLEISPTNRYLLARLGTFAASVMLQLLGQENASVSDRARAYGFLPDIDRNDSSLGGRCATAIEIAFDDAIRDKAFLLTDAGHLERPRHGVIIPDQLCSVWTTERAAKLLDRERRPALSRDISEDDQDKLVHRGYVERFSKDHVISVLQSSQLPKPATWLGLLKLWAYVAPEIKPKYFSAILRDVCIVPVQGEAVLYALSKVIRLGEKRLLPSDADLKFLGEHLLVLDVKWPRFLADQRRTAEEQGDEETKEEVGAALAILDAAELDKASDVSNVIDKIAGDVRIQKAALAELVQLAQIAAKLDATAGKSFPFVTRDLEIREPGSAVLFDAYVALDDFFEGDWCSGHMLHERYTASFSSCSSEEWRHWVSSGRAGLLGFAPLVPRRVSLWGKEKLETEIRRRGSPATPSYHFKTDEFLIDDWDFEESHWQHWATIAETDSKLWGRLFERIAAQPKIYWSGATSARARHVSTTRSTQYVTSDTLLPTWVLRLRGLPCVPDTRGVCRKPADVFCRTPETEPLMDVEPFVDRRLEEIIRPLLILLGVRDTPTTPDHLLDRLRALAQSDKPPINEVEKWYRHLDQMVETCSTTALANIKSAFQNEKIVLTESCTWETAAGVFLLPDEEVMPGAVVVRAAVRELSLWHKIGIAERPTADGAIMWLKELPSGEVLSQADFRRTRVLLMRYPTRIWTEREHWINLAREWILTESLGYALTTQSPVESSHLHEWVKQKTADLRPLPVEITQGSPFCDLPLLATCLEDRFLGKPSVASNPEPQPWLNRFGNELLRVQCDDEAETERLRAFAADLVETEWQITPKLEVVPYIDGVPAGMPRPAEVVWLKRVLYVGDFPPAKLARLVPDHLGKLLGRPEITAALNYCFGRSVADVTEYLEENFTLASSEAFAKTLVDVKDGVTRETARATPQPADQAMIGRDADEFTGSANLASVDGPESDAEPAEEILEPRVRHSRKPTKPSILERFARGQGFQRDGEHRYLHIDGSYITKAGGDLFPWEKRTARGVLVRRYWPKDHCLEREPLQLEADVWGLIDKFPAIYALILSNSQGDPIEILGESLREMRNAGELKLFPATYRLVLGR